MLKFRIAQRSSQNLFLLALMLLFRVFTDCIEAGTFPPFDLAMKQFKVPTNFNVELWAAEPQLGNPVCLTLDEQGRVYVGETFRLVDAGVWDIRHHMDYYTPDLACRTVEDRAQMIRSHFGASPAEFTTSSEVIQVLEDHLGSGRADNAHIFASGFNSLLDGVGAGLLARKGNIYYTDIPDLWLLRDPDHQGRPNSRESLSHGYGVHFGYSGHDLHGLRLGPDGRLYFSLGDRGMHVTTKEGKVLDYPDMGGVFRCNLDGSELEMFAYGLRNPQKLSFDDYGDLFTGDNNCDYGDAARLVYVVEGSDNGWRIANQFSETTPAGVWMSEKLWHLQFPGQAAYMIPPIAHIADGPSGLAHYPGVGMPDNYRDHFFLCDFRGTSGNSGIHSFAVSPKGAGFEMVDHTKFFWSVLATDAEFGPDGWLYACDWEEGWVHGNQGRIYRIGNTNLLSGESVKRDKMIIGEGMEKRTAAELGALLTNADQRIRQEAQFELVDRVAAKTNSPAKCESELLQAALKSKNRLARLHGIWGLGQLGRRDSKFVSALIPLMTDTDSEVRAQTAKVLGEAHATAAFSSLTNALTDANLRGRFFAALSLGKLGNPSATQPLIEMVRANADKDVFLRHAGVMGLVGCANKADLNELAKDASSSVRMAAVLVMRRRLSPNVAIFLHDTDPLIVLEAARAINDEPIAEAFPKLAELATHPTGDFMKDWRTLNALVRMGGASNAATLTEIALTTNDAPRLRSEALFALATWMYPANRDRITGLWRPRPALDAEEVRVPLRPVINQLLADPDKDVRVGAIHAAWHADLKEASAALVKLAANTNEDSGNRVQAIEALNEFKDAQLPEVVKMATDDRDENVRKEGNRLQALMKPADASKQMSDVLEKGSMTEQQGAFATLRGLQTADADALMAKWLDRLNAGTVPPEIQLDLIQAAMMRTSGDVRKKLSEYLAKQSKDDEFAGYRETLQGGNAEEGRKVFMERQDASCLRCHKIKGQGGEVGPELTGIITRHNREYILESILYPNKQIAAGFESLIVVMKNGDSYAGIVKAQTSEEISLLKPEDGQIVKLKKSEIEKQLKGLSAMPEGLGTVLSKQDIRNVVEFLATVK